MTRENGFSNGRVPRVLHFVPGFRSGGIETLVMGMYALLNKNQLQFDLLVDTCDALPDFDILRAQGGRVFQMGRYLDAPFAYQKKLNSIFSDYGNEYLAVHCHSVMRSLPVLFAARKFGVQHRILHSHTDSLKGSRLAFLSPFLAPITAIFGTDFFACSERAGKFFFGRRPFKVFPNSIPCHKFLYSEKEGRRMRNQLGLKADAFVVGHTGRFTYQKNHEFLIRIFSEIHRKNKNARLLLLGEGPLEESVRMLACQLGILDFVIFVGLQNDVPQYLSAMNIFILPSYYEGFCISLLEAQANGLPCIASDVVPEEVKITGSVKTLSLNLPASAWAELCIGVFPDRRADSEYNVEKIVKAGYDIESQANYVLGIYFGK